MVYTVTLNPAIDYIVSPAKFSAGEINRYQKAVYGPGGKGANVSLLLSSLGVRNRALGICAGFSGGEIVRLLEERGCDYAVRAELTETWFPTKEYEDFALPAGEYTALRVVIGEGAGQNWWCVAFPPLCLGAASETVEEAAQAGRFTDDQAALMTGETQGYVLKFKAIELWEGLKRLTGG